jgi:glyoxylase-like metal-dependent hydrolase (beta-lactamase superfamily II)
MDNYPIHIEIQPRVHLIRGANNARFPKANTLLVDDEILTLVDAGTKPDRILSTLKDLGHQPSDLDRIILTHYHTDHKGHAAHLREITECEVLCHPLAKEPVSSFDVMTKCIGINELRIREDWIRLVTEMLPHALGDYVVDGVFDVDTPIDCGETSLLPLHSPGHTPDHTCFGLNGYETILLVDIDLTWFGPWYGNITSDIEDFKKSIQKIIDLEPSVGVSSHLVDPISNGLENRLEKYLAIFEERDRKIIEYIDKGADTIEKLAQLPTIYPRLPSPVIIAFEKFMLEKHIELLEKSDSLTRKNGRLQLQKS